MHATLSRMLTSIAYVLATALVGACGSSTAPDGTVRYEFDFNRGAQGWNAGLADYPVSFTVREPIADYRPLPPELAANRRALYIQTYGENYFAFYKGKVTGLRPGRYYAISFNVEIATNTSNMCVGAGGPPGEGTHVKAGASAVEPVVVPMGSFYRMNIAKGDEGYGGSDALLIGNIANSLPCQSQNGQAVLRWEIKQLSSGASSLRVPAADDGSLWFLMGTDTEFFGSLELFYTRFSAVLVPQ